MEVNMKSVELRTLSSWQSVLCECWKWKCEVEQQGVESCQMEIIKSLELTL